jgi:hypothetical protein
MHSVCTRRVGGRDKYSVQKPQPDKCWADFLLHVSMTIITGLENFPFIEG